MITRIEVKNYRSLQYVSQEMAPFQVLVGPNASGKTTFLDVISFLSDLLTAGVDAAITRRSTNYLDLTFAGQGGEVELAVEAQLPTEIRAKYEMSRYSRLRYEVRLGLDAKAQAHRIWEERACLLAPEATANSLVPAGLRSAFPQPLSPPDVPRSILNQDYLVDTCHVVLSKQVGGHDTFHPEPVAGAVTGWFPAFNFGPQKTALGNLPEDETTFPATTWFKRLLAEGVQAFVLDSLNIRQASRPGQGLKFKTDGSNLPWVVEALQAQHPDQFQAWLRHVQTALPELAHIQVVERTDDKHRYLVLHYAGGIQVPSWLVSDGTLRLLALTLPAYLTHFQGIYLVEEPENGIHPQAIEAVFQSLSSVYHAQVWLASHSPVILSMVEPAQLLCFAKDQHGATDIVSGAAHPILQSWHGETNLSLLFASGILG